MVCKGEDNTFMVVLMYFVGLSVILSFFVTYKKERKINLFKFDLVITQPALKIITKESFLCTTFVYNFKKHCLIHTW